MAVKLEKRVARLAVSRFGADPDRVRQAYQDAVLASHRGEEIDLIDFFVRVHVLSASQAVELRESLEKTRIDKRDLEANGDGHYHAAPFDEERGTSPDLRPSANGDPQRSSRGQDSADALVAIGGYRILRKIGEGGMGTVYLAFDDITKQQVAVKVLADNLAGNAVLVERFQREAANSARLNHPNIVRGLDVGKDETNGKRYIVMEYVDGPSAQALLDQFGKLSIADAVHIVLDIAHGLEHAQSHNIVHRDIKPENILLTKTGVAKLADMGLAKQTDQISHLTATRQGFGTPYYMPYEQSINAKDADGRSDIFALGATLYHLVTGQVPYQGETQLEILEKKQAGVYAPATLVNPAVPERLELILEKMLARDRRDRYQTASDLIVDLERSELAAVVPSFINRESALQDPVVRARLAAVRQPTEPDIQLPALPPPDDPDVWFLIYYDQAGKTIKARATTTEVLARIRDGRLERTAQASHAQNGPYRYLMDYPLLRDALQSLDEQPDDEADETPPVPRWFWWLLAGGMLAIAALAVYLAWAFLK